VVDGGYAAGGDGGAKCGARRVGVGRDAGQVGSPPRGGGGPHRRRDADDGRGQVGKPRGGDRSDQRGARQYERRQVEGLHGGHSPGGRGGRVGSYYADGRHQVKWRGFGGNAVRRSRLAGGVTPSRESSAAGSQAKQPPPDPGRSKSTTGSVTASRASSAAERSADEVAAAPATVAAQVPLPPSRPGTPPEAAGAAAATTADGGEDIMKQDSPPPVPPRVRPPAVEEAGPAGAESGALAQWTPPHAPVQLQEWHLRALYEAIPVPKQGPAWQWWLTRLSVQYELPDGVMTDLPALLEAADAPLLERVASRLSKVMDGATADDIPPVVAWEWVCCSPPYLGERDPDFHDQDARTERHVREASGILVIAAQVESTQIHVSARRD